MSELVWGIKNGDLDYVKSFVESKEIDINKEIDGRPPLHYAADYGQRDVIEYLVSKGADINVGRRTEARMQDPLGAIGRSVALLTTIPLGALAKDKHGISAVLAAIWEGHTSCVQTLLDSGADKCGTAPDGTSYVDAADKPEIKALLQ